MMTAMRRYSVQVVADAGVPVCQEDIKIAFERVTRGYVSVDETDDGHYVVLTEEVIPREVVKAAIEKLDGADPCEVVLKYEGTF